MVINVSVQYNGGLLSDIILLTLCDYSTLGNPFNTMFKKEIRTHLDLLSIPQSGRKKYQNV